ncbi:hypothetical protein WR25_22545 isoform B [Diploscapter pachys]|uniref:Nucleosome assembly protein n=1 Tax=Diploscapter pachys TaxID=2018661 RepID=A0A2A2JXP4_9BILA|nr:hypothetical protein WR25_22545 isoform B [Diploscapter pachys]
MNEILKVEQKYNKLRHPHYERRAEHIKNLPNFWSTTLLNHHQISSIINPVEEEVLKHLEILEIEEFEDIKSGYVIRLTFGDNEYFENDKIEKEINLAGEKPCTATTPIKWKEGKCFIKNDDENNPNETMSFFEWLIRNVDPTLDDIAEVIKDDIWPNPLQYFLCPALDATNDTYEEFLDDEEQLEEVDDEGGSEEGSEAEGGSNKVASEDDVDEEEEN